MTTTGASVERKSRVVTFLFTDIEGSTQAWESDPASMSIVLEQHDSIVRSRIGDHRGALFKHTGDGVAAVFPNPSAALGAALDVQLALSRQLPRLRVRIAVYSGVAAPRDGDWFGTAPNRVARLLAASPGGQILFSDEVRAGASLPEGAEAEDLGVHRLRDLPEGIRVFRLRHPDLPLPQRPLRSLDALLTNLPTVTSSFVGREDEVTLLSGWIKPGRLVTLTGPGGVGKTRLALHVSETQLPKHPDGVWLCEFAAVTDPNNVAGAVVSTLGLIAEGQAPADRLVDGLRRKRCLLVLDNCEHLALPIARLVEQIRRECPMTSLLATSRVPLAIDGEVLLLVEPLDGSHAEAPAVRLFVDRARAARHDFDLRGGHTDAVMSICRHLDGMPLAIELAAAKVRSMTPNDIGRRLGERFRLLRGSTADPTGRRRSLEAVVEWSYDLLTDAERRLFDRLTVFAGSFSLESVEQICADGELDPREIADHLDSLVQHSMVNADISGTKTRYDLLETLGAFGRQRLARAGEHERWSRNHALHFADLVESLGRQLRGPGEVEAGHHLLAELDNVRAAMAWSTAHQDLDLAMRVGAEVSYLSYEMQRLEALSWCEQAIALQGSRSHRLFPAVGGIVALGWAQLRDWERGIELAEEAISTTASSHVDESPWPHLARVQIALWSGHLLEADAWVDELVEVARRLGDPWSIARSLGLRAWVTALTDPSRARSPADAALEAARASGNPSVLSFVLWDDAQVYMHAGDLDQALESVRRAGEVARPTADLVTRGIANQLEMSLLDALGDERGRWHCGREALRLLAAEGTMTTLAGITMLAIVEGFARLGRVDVASKLLARSTPAERDLIETLEAQLPNVVAVLKTGPPRELPSSDAEFAAMLVSEIDDLLDSFGPEPEAEAT